MPARDLNLPKLTFQVIRRTIATLAQKKGPGKGSTGCPAALANCNDDGRLYAGDTRKRAIDDQLDQPSIAWINGPDPATCSLRSSKDCLG